MFNLRNIHNKNVGPCNTFTRIFEYYLLKTSRLNKSTAERSTDDALEAILELEPEDDDFAC